jgi:general secretion pathway protein M
MSRPSIRIIALQILTIVLVLLPFFAAGGYVWTKHQQAQTLLEQLEPRHARLQGLMAQEAEIEAQIKLAQGLISAYAFPAAADGTPIANDAQQRVKTALEQAGFRVESIQVKDGAEAGDFLRLNISAKVDGNVHALRESFLKLREITPVLVVDSFRFTNEGPLLKALLQRTAGTLNIVVLRSKP